ncbi:MAG: tetratricopeptide repeat protein [Candidatus Brocadiia bacterium]
MNARRTTTAALLMILVASVTSGPTPARAAQAQRAATARRAAEAVRLDRPRQRPSDEPQPGGPRPGRRPIFLPIVDGELLIEPYIRRYSYGRFFGPAGSFFRYEERGSELYWPHSWRPRVRSRELLVARGSPDLPGTVYVYDPDFRAGYDTYYFPRQAAPAVVVESPTVPEPGPAEQAPEAPMERRGGFGSDLSPMLGGDEYVPLYFALGEARLVNGDFAGALEAFQQSVSAEPESGVPKLALAVASAAHGDYRKGAHILRRGLRATPDWSGIELDLTEVLGAKTRRDELLAALRAAVDERPKDPDPRLLLAFCHFAERRLTEAQEVLELAEIEDERPDPVREALLEEVRLAIRRREAEKGETAEPAEEG